MDQVLYSNAMERLGSVSAHTNPYEGNSHNLRFSDSHGLQFQDAGLRNVVIDADLVAEWSLSIYIIRRTAVQEGHHSS